jgi:hypothetical protein
MKRLPWWFLVPLATFGAGTAPVVIYGGARLRSRAHVVAGVLYGVLFVVFFVGVQFADTNRAGVIDAVIAPAWLISWLGGTAHAAVLQSAVRVRTAAPAEPVDPALAEVLARRARRHEARALLAADPALATELMIGRPDLGRQYDDGGLVDVNNVPAATLAAELSLSPGIAEQITAARDRLGGFGSAEELVVYCDGITMAGLDAIRDRLVFRPR